MTSSDTAALSEVPAVASGRRALATILAGRSVTAIGTGIVGPYLLIYLAQVQDFTIVQASFAASVISILAVLGGLFSGWLIDTTSWRTVAVIVFAGSAVGTGGYAVVDGLWSVYLTAGIFGLGVGAGGALWPTLIARSFDGEARGKIFSWDFMIANGGLAVGAVVGGWIVADGSKTAYRSLFVADAVSFILCGVILLAFGRFSTPEAKPRAQAANRSEARRSIPWAHSLLFTLIALLGFVGYGQFEGILPAFLAGHTSVTGTSIALVYMINPIVIVGGGLLLNRALDRVSNKACFVLSIAIIGLAWAVISVVPSIGDPRSATALAIAASAIFAVAELFMARGLPGVVNALATDATRGRYNGAASTAMNFGRVLGPTASGFALAGSLAGGLFPVLALVALSAAAAAQTYLKVDREKAA